MLSKAKAMFARRPKDRDRLQPMYRAIVAAGRDPFWYREGGVPDTVDGRFDMIAAITSIVLLRMEQIDGEEAKHASVMLTELFIEDMDESLRQIGIGDYVVGKHVGRMISALGGRLTAFRAAAQDRDFLSPVRRNIYHDAPPKGAEAEQVAARLEGFERALIGVGLQQFLDGELPSL